MEENNNYYPYNPENGAAVNPGQTPAQGEPSGAAEDAQLFNADAHQYGSQTGPINDNNVYAARQDPEPRQDPPMFNAPVYPGANERENPGQYGPYAAARQNAYPYAGQSAAPAKAKKEKKPHPFVKKLGAAAAIALVCGLVGGGVFRLTSGITKQNVAGGGQVSTVITTAKGSDETYDVSEVVKNVMPAMVSIDITATQTVQNPFSFFGSRSYEQEVTGSGSGIIISQTDTSLFIATNNHVIEDANSITVTFVNDKTAKASVKGTDPDADLAVIEIPLDEIDSATLEEIKVAVMGSSDALQLGEPAIAIGNALGYGQSVTVGHISALQRKVQLTDRTMTLLQTDAAINPGNSGGALLNSKGEVVGINSVKYSSTDVEGIGYAIPISDAIPIINALVNGTALPESEQAYLGISGIDVTEQYQQRFGLPEGIYIEEVTEGSPAEKGGIRNYDIITSFDGTKVTTMDELTDLMDGKKAGDTVEITVMRSENNAYSPIELTVTLGSVSNKPETKKSESKQDNGDYDDYGGMDDFFRFFG